MAVEFRVVGAVGTAATSDAAFKQAQRIMGSDDAGAEGDQVFHGVSQAVAVGRRVYSA